MIFKKTIWFVLSSVVVLSTTIFANPITFSETQGDEIILNFNVPSYSFSTIEVNGEKYQQIIATEDAAPVLVKGEPQLPYYTASVIIPETGAFKAELRDAEYEVISTSIKMISSKGSISRSKDPSTTPYEFGPAYNIDILINESPLALSNPFIMRDFRGASIRVNPFGYNPVTGTIKVLKSAKIIITKDTTLRASINEQSERARGVSSSAFDEAYSNRFLNYESTKTRYTAINDGEKMIVICASSYVSQMKDLVDWKNQKGIATTLYSYPSETGGSGSSAIKSFIQQKYDNEKITYVLLVGDHEDIPSIVDDFGELSDPSYTKVDGSDPYPDIFVGRFSVNSSTYAANMVDKVLRYEKNPDENDSWYTRGIAQASNEGSPADYEWISDMRDVMLGATYTKIDEVYQELQGSLDTITDALTQGIGWYLYMGHGTKYDFGFYRAYVDSSTFDYTSDYRNPVVIAVGCSNGDFGFGADCIAEYTTKQSKKGAIVYLGSTILQPWTPPQHGQKEMVKLLTDESHISIGGIMYNGGSKILEVGHMTGSHLETFNTWTLFGDPSLMVFNDAPQTLSVSAPSFLGSGYQTVPVSFETAIDGRVAIYSESNGLLASKLLKNDSFETLEVNLDGETEVLLTVTGRNKVPVIKTIPVSSGPFITITSPNGGEEIRLDSNVDITWSDNIDGQVKIDIMEGSSLIATIAATTESDGLYSWHVPADFTPGTNYRIVVTSLDDGSVTDTSNSNFSILKHSVDQSVLAVDFNQAATDLIPTTPDYFVGWAIGNVDAGIAAPSTNINGYVVTLGSGSSIDCLTTPASQTGMNARNRSSGYIPNSGSFTQANLMRERIASKENPIDPATGNGTGNGLYLKVSGLDANKEYLIQTWGVDSTGTNPDATLKAGFNYGFDATAESPGYASLPELGSYTILGGSSTIADNDAYSVNGLITTDSSGTLIYKQISSIDHSVINGFKIIPAEIALGSVPDMTGLAQATAESSIVNAGFDVGSITEGPSSTVVAGHVISQDPAGGTSIALGSSVALHVSTGAPAAGSVLLAVDLHQGEQDPLPTTPDYFDGWVLGNLGAGVAAPSTVINGFTVTLGTGDSKESLSDPALQTGFNARNRNGGYVLNSGDFTQQELLRERIASDVDPTDPATGNGTGNGIYLKISDLAPNTEYRLQVWGVDSTGTNPAATLKNGYNYGFDATAETAGYSSLPQLGSYTVAGSPSDIADNNEFSIVADITTDGDGSLVYKQISNIDRSVMNGFILSTSSSSSSAGYLTWANANGISGEPTDDDDGDGLSNLINYSVAEKPQLIRSGNGFEFVHKQRRGDSSLNYTLETTDDLMSGVWTPVTPNSETTVLDGGYDEIRHTISESDTRLFIRLRVNME